MSDKIKLQDDRIRKAYYQLADAIYLFEDVLSTDKDVSKDRVISHHVLSLKNTKALIKERLDDNYLWD